MLASDIIADVKKSIGNCDDATAYSILTDAIRTLANKNNFDVCIGYVDICSTTDGKTVTLPREIDTPLAVNVGGCPAYFRNRWYEFHLNGMGSNHMQCRWTWDDFGEFPVFMDIISPSVLIAVADLKTDLGVPLTIFGYDQNDQWIRTQNPDGSWQDGFKIPINLISDFPNQLIVPDPSRIFARYFTTPEINSLLCGSAHQFVTGEFVTLSLTVGPLPTPLVNGAGYYVRVMDDTHIGLYATLSGALSGVGPVIITSASALSQLTLTDTRSAKVQTKFNSATPHRIQTGMILKFTGAPLPLPLSASASYYARVIDTNNFTAYATKDDAENNVNPIDVTTPGGAVNVLAEQKMNPNTIFSFSVNHGFLQGDAVTVQNSTGSLPTPLLAGVTYYARYISATTISLHNTLADASAGTSAIVCTDTGAGQTVVVKKIPASASIGNSNNITAVNHNLSVGDFVQFATDGTFPANISQGTTYQVGSPLSSNTFTLNTTQPQAVNVTALGSGQLYLLVTRVAAIAFPDSWQADASQLNSSDIVNLATDGALPSCSPAVDQVTNYYIRKLDANNVSLFTTSAYAADTAQRLTASRARSANVSTIVTSADHNLSTNDYVNITGMVGTVSGVLSTVTINVGGTGYTNGETVTIADGAGHTAQGSIHATGGVVKSIFITNGGLGFTVAQALTITGQTSAANNANVSVASVAANNGGSLLQCSITSGGTGYTNGETATITDASGHTAQGTLNVAAGVVISINISVGGIGFGSGTSLTVVGDSSAANNASVTAGNVALANNSVYGSSYNGKRLQITKVNATTFTYASVGLNEPTTVDVGGIIVIAPIQVQSLGAGNQYLAINRSISVKPFSSDLNVSSAYLQSNATVRFLTDGTLPDPIAVATDYKAVVNADGTVQVQTMGGAVVTLNNIGTGNHSITLARVFSVTMPMDFVVTQNNYNDGDAVTLSTTGTLPSGLALATTYYLRRIGDDHVEIYDTAAHATNLLATTGRIVPIDTGSGTHSFIQVLPNFQVKKVERITKGLSSGYISLYAWDTGRADNLTKIGQYYPDELYPKYRRLKIGKSCQWIRMRYRRKLFDLKYPTDWIPFENKVALLMMVRALNLYKSEFAEKGKEFEDTAARLMEEEDAMRQGPTSLGLQFNADITTNPDEQYMS